MGLLQLKLFMVLLISAVCSKISVQTPTCGNNTFFIQYPFKLLQEGQKNPHHITPYDLKCNGQGVVVLDLPFSGEFYVRDIDYFQQKIQLYDPSNCLPRRLKNLSLSSSPFVAVRYQKYTFFSCPLESPSSRNLTAIRCLSNSTASVIVADSETPTMDGIKNLTACKVMYSLQIPVSQVFEYVYNGIDGDLQLAWNDPSSKGNNRGKTSSKPGALTIILICAITISTALLVSLFCLGCGLSVVVVMLDIEEANYQGSWSCSTTRVWERARFRLSRASSGAAGPLDEVSFMSSGSQQPRLSAPRGAAAPLDEPSSTPPPPPPSIAAVHPFGYFLSFMPSSPQVPRGAELPSTLSSPNVAAADAPDGFVSFVSSPEVLSMPAAGDGEVFIDAVPPDSPSYISSTHVPRGAAAPLDESSSTPLTPSVAAAHPFGYFLSSVASPQDPRGASAALDELPSTLSSPSVAAEAIDSFVSLMPSPEVPSMPAAYEDGYFIDDSSVISQPLPPPPPLPPSIAEGHPLDYFLSLLSAHFGRGNAASLDELSSTPSSPSVTGDFSVTPSPAEALEVHDDEFAFTEELPTEDIIIGGSECISGPNGDSCTICLENYEASERLRLIRKCNHCFHTDCLEQWLQRKNTCPICRTDVI